MKYLFSIILVILLFFYPVSATDFDGDGLADEWELKNGLRIDKKDANEDPDHDGLTNKEESDEGTDPKSADSDGDGVYDGDEVRSGTNPLDANKPTSFKISYLIAIPIVISLTFILFYLLNLVFKAISKKSSKSEVKPISNPIPKIVPNPIPRIQPRQIPINKPTQAPYPLTTDQKARLRDSIFNKFDSGQATKAPPKAQPKKEESKDSKILNQLSTIAKKSESPLEELKKIAGKKR